MGCFGSNDRNRNYDKEPLEIATMDPSKMPKITIHTLLTKLKLKRCSKYVRSIFIIAIRQYAYKFWWILRVRVET